MSAGLVLAERYAREVVEPVVQQHFPGLPYAVARLGSGSDVLGLDDELSQDHDWGLRLTLLLPDTDGPVVEAVDRALEAHLPETAFGLPVRTMTTWDGSVRHRVEVATARDFVRSRTGVEPRAGLTTADWLSLTGQAVLEVTSGPVFVDLAGELSRAREALTWYPDDLWSVLVAVDWHRIAEELPLVGRAGHRGDDLGSRIITARLVDAAIHLGFLLERRWSPYPKWVGTVWAGRPRGAAAGDELRQALEATTWPERQAHLQRGLEGLHQLQREVGLPALDESPVAPFFDRPFVGVRDELVDLLLRGVADGDARHAYPAGSVEQWVSAVPVLTSPELRWSVSGAVRVRP